MPLIVCPDCQQQISDVAAACVKCGRPMKKAETSYTEKMSRIQYDLNFIWIVVLTLLLIGAG
jgi:predicted amidophosphoribosyltransferase